MAHISGKDVGHLRARSSRSRAKMAHIPAGGRKRLAERIKKAGACAAPASENNPKDYMLISQQPY